VQCRHVAQVGQRGTTPQLQRVAQDPAGLGPLPRGQRPPAPDGERQPEDKIITLARAVLERI
jgi:hypothetical protein